MWKGIVDTIDLAAAEGLKGHPAVRGDFREQLLHNDQVFAAFKVHRLQGDMARRMLDGDGNLKSFEQWAEEVKPIASHQCGRWLRTEYDTAVKRAAMAADWQHFEDEKDVLPNLRWVPSTAAVPDAFHQSMWNTVLPVDHPFWSGHHPGDRWGCQCSLEATDDPATDVPEADYKTSPGLDNNPGIDAKLFNETHPYFPDSCDSCPFRGSPPSVPTNLAKDCYHCQYADAALPDDKREVLTPDEEFGERLMVSSKADKAEIEDNTRCAESILSSFPEDKIVIRGHSTEPGVKNPEYLINELLGDRKGVASEKGITAGFKKAIEQGCSAVVIDLDNKMHDQPLRSWELAKYIAWRYRDFRDLRVEKCYIVYHNRAVMIDASFDSREKIAEEIKKLRPR